MMITNDHLVGFAAGAAVTALALYWYDQNRERVDSFLQAQGMGLGQPGMPWQGAPQYAPAPPPSGDQELSIEELMAQKERLEDMIAELQATQEG